MRRVNAPQSTPDRGRRLENAVFLALRQRGGALHYAAEKDLWECDFVTDAEAIQVCHALTPENSRRELAGLRQACQLPDRRQRRALIVTLDQRETLQDGGQTIEIYPAWQWLRDLADS